MLVQSSPSLACKALQVREMRQLCNFWIISHDTPEVRFHQIMPQQHNIPFFTEFLNYSNKQKEILKSTKYTASAYQNFLSYYQGKEKHVHIWGNTTLSSHPNLMLPQKYICLIYLKTYGFIMSQVIQKKCFIFIFLKYHFCGMFACIITMLLKTNPSNFYSSISVAAKRSFWWFFSCRSLLLSSLLPSLHVTTVLYNHS